ncbi:MAG: hypothetical protein KAQ89_07100 [Planctomycetes bacterium]|nr:hypothetical protein [Planctomycetota bacterium]
MTVKFFKQERGVIMKRTTIFISVALILVVFMNGCCSGTFAPKVSESNKKKITQIYFDIAIGTKQNRGDFLKEDIENTGLFRKVDEFNDIDCSEHELIAEFGSRGDYANPIPLFTGLTLGFFPTIIDDEQGYTFDIYLCGNPENRISIDCRYKGTAILGWYAIIDRIINPNQFDPCDCEQDAIAKQRFYDYMSWMIIQKEEDIRRLIIVSQ